MLKILKENIPLFSIVPLVLGGIGQVIFLLSISPSFVRFFSVTQLLPDGILILSLFILPVFTYLYYEYIKYKFKSIGWFKSFRNFYIIIAILKKQRKINKIFFCFQFSLLFIGSFIGLVIESKKYTDYAFNESFEFNFELTNGYYIYVLMLCLIPYLYIQSLIIYFQLRKKLKQIHRILQAEDAIKTFFITLMAKTFLLIPQTIFGAILIFLFFIPSILNFYKARTLFNIPNNTLNLTALIAKKAKKYKVNKDSISVEYYNDTYVFLKLRKMTIGLPT